MEKEYRLIQIIESRDNISGEDIVIFELTQTEYNHSGSGYTFNPETSPKNHFFVYENSPNIIKKFLTNPEEIKSMNLKQFESKLVKTPEGLRRTFYSEKISAKRNQSDFWYSGAIESIENDKQVAFQFSHVESSGFDYGDNYDEDTNDLIPYDQSDIELEDETNFIVVDKHKVIFSFQNSQGIYTRIKGKVISIETFENGQISRIKTSSNWALTDGVPVNYEFEKTPISPLNKSDRNIVVSVLGSKSEPSIKRQWTLMFGNYMGEVTFE
jgi:hypothetical protein